MSIEAWGIVTAVGMMIAAVIAFVPFVPGPALVWAIGLIYAVVTRFEMIGIPAVVVMTLLMIVGSTADWWTRAFGLGSEGSLTCGSFVASTAGAIAGTFLIPIPLVGTLLGAAAGVAALVFYQQEDWDAALKAARGILSAWIASFFVEFIVSIGVIAVFVRSLLRI